MFSGIVEASGRVMGVIQGPATLALEIEKPSYFSDLNVGDSISVDGVCLTLEGVTPLAMRFTLGPETLQVTGWTPDGVKNRVMNLERSLRLNDRIHGHMVTGHVDAASTVLAADWKGETLTLEIAIPEILRPLIWPKGSIAVNGVSLTVNQVAKGSFSVGLIPETLKRTNLKHLKTGDTVNLEADNMARGLHHFASRL